MDRSIHFRKKKNSPIFFLWSYIPHTSNSAHHMNTNSIYIWKMPTQTVFLRIFSSVFLGFCVHVIYVFASLSQLEFTLAIVRRCLYSTCRACDVLRRAGWWAHLLLFRLNNKPTNDRLLSTHAFFFLLLRDRAVVSAINRSWFSGVLFTLCVRWTGRAVRLFI